MGDMEPFLRDGFIAETDVSPLFPPRNLRIPGTPFWMGENTLASGPCFFRRKDHSSIRLPFFSP